MRILGFSITRCRKAARKRLDTRRVIRDFLGTIERLAQEHAASAQTATAESQ